MRVTFLSFPDSFTSQVSKLSAREIQLENEISTGKRVSQLSDDPTAACTTLDAQAQNSQVAQYQKNISSLQTLATASSSAISSLSTLASRAGEIATLASDGTKSKSDLTNYASEVDQLIQQAVSLANTTNNGDYIFGGTASGSAPYTATTDSSGNVTAVAYNGNSNVPSVHIATGLAVSVQVPGSNTSGSGAYGLITDSRAGADLFNHLIALRNDLTSGNTTTISRTDGANLTKDEDNLSAQLGTNGLVQTELVNASSVASSQSTVLSQTVSNASDVDLTTAATQLSAAQTALEAGSSVLTKNLSLLTYLG